MQNDIIILGRRITPANNFFEKEEKAVSYKNCEFCEHYLYDYEEETYYCNVSFDEDETVRFLTGHYACPFFKYCENEYKMVEKQN